MRKRSGLRSERAIMQRLIAYEVGRTTRGGDLDLSGATLHAGIECACRCAMIRQGMYFAAVMHNNEGGMKCVMCVAMRSTNREFRAVTF